MRFQKGDKVLACLCSDEEFESCNVPLKVKKMIGTVWSTPPLDAYVAYVTYDDLGEFTIPLPFLSPVKEIPCGDYEPIYRVNNAAGGHSYIKEQGWGTQVIYDTCLTDMNDLIACINDVLQTREREYYDRLIAEKKTNDPNGK